MKHSLTDGSTRLFTQKRRLFLVVVFIGNLSILFAQNTFTAIIKDEDTKEVLPFANVILKGTQIGGSADSTGKVTIENIPDGKQTLVFSYVGYRKKEKDFTFPLKTSQPVIVYLEKSEELQTVTVVSTRTNNRIEEIPTRVEVLGNEEVVEETGISPGNISKLLGETSGINVQRTSAVSGNVTFRIQGLPGKYTQLLKDGFPAYGGFASGLSLLQIPPLDLKQVEIIKGSASTLYGSDAIAGIVNLISKKPSDKQGFSILLNLTHKGGSDISSFFSAEKGKVGFTLLTGFNTQKAIDVSGNNFTDIPQYNRVVVIPKFFLYLNEDDHLIIGLAVSYENRLGGDVFAIKNQVDAMHSFYENNETKYLSGNVKYEHEVKDRDMLTVRGNITNYNRVLKTNVNVFEGNQVTSFSEISYLVKAKKHHWVSGVNFYYDRFLQTKTGNSFLLDYSHQTVGVFSQDNWQITEKLSLEPGIRYDYNLNNRGFFLPRLAVMYKFVKQFSARLSGGLGYKLPTPFTDDAERTRYQNVIFPDGLKAERSMGVNLDFTFKTPLFKELFLTVNQAFFIVQIQDPIIANLDSLPYQTVFYENAGGKLFNQGLTTNIRLSLDDFTLYVDYTLIDARKKYDDNKPLELTPQNRITSTLAYEDEDNGWKAGLEAFYFGHQFLEDGTKTPDYWLLGASVQKRIGHFTLVLNVENMLDVRQTRYENIVSGDLNNPVFSELWAPLDGVLGNFVLKFNLF